MTLFAGTSSSIVCLHVGRCFFLLLQEFRRPTRRFATKFSRDALHLLADLFEFRFFPFCPPGPTTARLPMTELSLNTGAASDASGIEVSLAHAYGITASVDFLRFFHSFSFFVIEARNCWLANFSRFIIDTISLSGSMAKIAISQGCHGQGLMMPVPENVRVCMSAVPSFHNDTGIRSIPIRSRWQFRSL